MAQPVVQPRRARSDGLDGLRGLAALAVLGFHVWLYARPDPPATSTKGVANLAASDLRWGLILFFVLSGYLLYRPWVRAAADGTRPDLRAYVRRRAARILPAYYLALVGSLVLLEGAGGVPGVRLPSEALVPAFFVFGENFSTNSILTLDPPMWTLVVEVGFYALLPLLGLLAIRLRRLPAASVPIAVFALGMAWNAAMVEAGGSLALTKALPAMLPYFAVGMLVAVTGDRLGFRAWRLAVVAMAGLAGQAWLDSHASGTTIALAHELPVALAFAAVVALASGEGCPSVLRGRALVALGTVSYGVYLWNVPIIWSLRAAGLLPLTPSLALAPVAALALAAATASWFAVERPAIRSSRRPGPRRTSLSRPLLLPRPALVAAPPAAR